MLLRIVTLALVAPFAPAQTAHVEWQQPTPIADPSAIGVVEARTPDGFVIALRFPIPGRPFENDELPLGRSVEHWELARLPDGSFVVLAGGVRASDPLTVHFIAPGKSSERWLQTEAGLRLGSSFGDGVGSWPLVGNRDLLLIAYEEKGRAVLQVQRTGGGLIAREELPRGATGFAIPQLDLESYEFTVRIDGARGAIDSLSFEHPAAPRAVFEPPDLVVLDFGIVSEGEGPVTESVRVKNVGAFRLEATVTVTPDGVFSLAGDPHLGIEPGGSAMLSVHAQSPGDATEATGRLEVATDSPSGGVSLELRVRSALPIEAAPEPVLPSVGSADQPAVTNGGIRGRAPTVPALRVLPPVIHVHGVVWDHDEVVVHGRLLGPAPPGVSGIIWRGERVREEQIAPIRPSGTFSARVRATALEPLSVAFASPTGTASGFVPGGRAPVVLREAEPEPPPEPEEGAESEEPAPPEGGLEVLAPPGQPFLLAQLTARGEVLRLWRGRADARGRARVPLAFLGEGVEPMHLAVVTRDPVDGGVACSEEFVSAPVAPR